jgi:hypothetical protein
MRFERTSCIRRAEAARFIPSGGVAESGGGFEARGVAEFVVNGDRLASFRTDMLKKN